jgi:hypothetical protein
MTASSIRRRSAAWTILVDWMYRSRRPASEIFHQTSDSSGMPATTSAGWKFDLNDNYHLLGYVRRGIENADATDRYSWYASVLFTF